MPNAKYMLVSGTRDKFPDSHGLVVGSPERHRLAFIARFVKNKWYVHGSGLFDKLRQGGAQRGACSTHSGYSSAFSSLNLTKNQFKPAQSERHEIEMKYV